MSEELLHHPQVCPAIEQMSREAVPEDVGTHRLGDAGRGQADFALMNNGGARTGLLPEPDGTVPAAVLAGLADARELSPPLDLEPKALQLLYDWYGAGGIFRPVYLGTAAHSADGDLLSRGN